jgi:hypothetical protein
MLHLHLRVQPVAVSLTPPCCASAVLLWPQVNKAGGIKAAMFHAAYAYKQFWMKLGFNSDWASPVANRVVFKNTQVCMAAHRQSCA